MAACYCYCLGIKSNDFFLKDNKKAFILWLNVPKVTAYYWFSSYQMKDKFILMPVSIEDMEGIENFAALIIRKDNPNVLDIVADFSNTVAMFRVKPNSHD